MHFTVGPMEVTIKSNENKLKLGFVQVMAEKKGLANNREINDEWLHWKANNRIMHFQYNFTAK